jgi:hypothetical protein
LVLPSGNVWLLLQFGFVLLRFSLKRAQLIDSVSS